MKRQIITIDDHACNGCGACIPDCPEGALQMIDGKARLVGDLFCDGLGACIGACPEGAINVEFREAEPYSEKTVMKEHIIPKGENTIRAHFSHLKDHGADEFLEEALAFLESTDNELYTRIAPDYRKEIEEELPVFQGCPGSLSRTFGENEQPAAGTAPSELTHWPVQMHLINPRSPHFRKADFLLAADCTAFAMGAFHGELLRNKRVGIACPKLDSGQDSYLQKLIELIDSSEIDTMTVAVMEVPCCGGLIRLAAEAIKQSRRTVPLKYIQISTEGKILQEQWLQV